MAATILVVDDSPTVLRLTAAPLAEQGYRVLTAVDGEQALEMVAKYRPDLLILDIILPKKNGFQVCRELKTNSNTRDIRIILLSSKSNESDRFWGLRQGADSYMTKPFDTFELLASIADLLGQTDVSTAALES